MSTKTSTQLRQMLAEMVDAAGMPLVANRTKCAEVYLLQVLNGKRDISKRIAESLGYRIVVQPKPEKIFLPISTEKHFSA